MRIEAYSQVQKFYEAKKAVKTQARGNAGASDKLLISGIGRDIQVAKQALAGAGDIREDVTASIKSRIQSGTYDVSAESFADKLLQKFEEMR